MRQRERGREDLSGQALPDLSGAADDITLTHCEIERLSGCEPLIEQQSPRYGIHALLRQMDGHPAQ